MQSPYTPCQVAPPEVDELVLSSQAKVETKGRIFEGMDKNPEARSIMEFTKEGETLWSWRRDGLLFAKRGCMFMFKRKNLRGDMLKECKEPRSAGCQMVHHRTILRKDAHHWPRMWSRHYESCTGGTL